MGKKGDSQTINGNFKGKDILSLDQFSPQDLSILFKHTKKMRDIAKGSKPSDLLKGNIITLIFYEPSSRTFGSFVASVKQLSGSTIEILNPENFSSVSKGESLEDTIRVFEAYCDIIILRHPEVGASKIAAEYAKSVPIINAGDGIGEHPTQALLDLYTIFEHTKKLEGITGVLTGDMINGRTVHSLIRGLSKYKNNKLYLLSPRELRLGKEDITLFKKNGVTIYEIDKASDIPKNADFWYWTRVQKERFRSKSDYEKVKNRFILTNKLIREKAEKNTIFMHPLPRVGEILNEVDEDSRAVYLKSQIRNGMYIRMALVSLVLGKIK